MIFLPIPDGGRDGHVARIGGFVILRQFFGRTVSDQVIVLDPGEGRDEIRFERVRVDSLTV